MARPRKALVKLLRDVSVLEPLAAPGKPLPGESVLPPAAAGRKLFPVATGVVDYFPDALLAIAELSRIGNDQHNPGQPLHWARGKGGNNADELMRHFIQRGTPDGDGALHSTKVAWRALAILQLELEARHISSGKQAGVSGT